METIFLLLLTVLIDVVFLIVRVAIKDCRENELFWIRRDSRYEKNVAREMRNMEQWEIDDMMND